MNKTLLTTFAVLFSFVILLNLTSLALADISVLDHTTSLTVYQMSSSTGYFILNNTGTNNISNIIYSAQNLPSGTTISFTPTSITLLPNGTSARVDYTITANSEANLGEHTVTMNITSSLTAYSTSYTFVVNVKQNFCELGPKGSEITLNLDNPDNSDDFYPGDNMSVDFTVRTHTDVDFTVEVELYDLTTQEVVADDSLDDNLDDDEQDYTLYLKVPSDIDQSDDYIVRIKAYGDNEDEQCKEDGVSINVVRKNHELTIDKVTYPNLACNQQYNLGVKLENTGKKDETNVMVSISSSSLGIDQDITKDIDSGDTATYTFTGTMPVVAPGTYSLRVDVTSDSGDADTSDIYTLNLQTNCRTQKTDASLSIVPSQSYFGQENTLIVTLTNTGDVSTSYTLNASSITWASIVSIQPTSLTLGPTESGNIYITFMPNTNAASINALPVSIKANGFSKSQTLQVELQQKSAQGNNSSFLDTIKNNSWLFILNVALLIIIIVLIIIVATRSSRNRNEEPREARLKNNKKGRK
jgi:uncharacterized membrane protein